MCLAYSAARWVAWLRFRGEKPQSRPSVRGGIDNEHGCLEGIGIHAVLLQPRKQRPFTPHYLPPVPIALTLIDRGASETRFSAGYCQMGRPDALLSVTWARTTQTPVTISGAMMYGMHKDIGEGAMALISGTFSEPPSASPHGPVIGARPYFWVSPTYCALAGVGSVPLGL